MPFFAPPPPIAEKFEPEDPRSVWSVDGMNKVLARHEAGLSVAEIAAELRFPAREIVEAIRRNCSAHEHTFSAVVRVNTGER